MSVKNAKKSTNVDSSKSSKIKMVKNLNIKPDCKPNNKLNSFKKKKLKNMQIKTQNQVLIKDIEHLLSNKKEWTEKDLEKLFSIMYYPSEVASIYGFQIEKGILEYIDSAYSFKSIQLSALCLSRFANIKKSNGALLLQRVLKTLLNIGKEYFDFFDISSNLIELTYDFPVPLLNFPEIVISNETISILIKRINFLFGVIYFTFDIKNELSLPNIFDDLVRMFFAFLSITPGELLCKKMQESSMIMSIPNTVNSNLWKILNCVFLSLGFNHIEYVPKMCGIIKLCLLDDLIGNDLSYNLYIENILIFLSNIIGNGCVYCLSSVNPLIQFVVQRINAIVSLACTNSQEHIITLYLQILNKFLSHYRDKNIEKSISNLKDSLVHIKTNLIYLNSKSIYSNNQFKAEYNLFLKSFKLCVYKSCHETGISYDYFKSENSNYQNKSSNSDEEILMESQVIDIEEIKIEDTSTMEIWKITDQCIETREVNTELPIGREPVVPNSIPDQETNDMCEITNVIAVEEENPDLQTDSNHLQLNDSKFMDLEEMLKSFIPI